MELTALNILGREVALIVRDRIKFKQLTFSAQHLDDGGYSGGGLMSRTEYEQCAYVLSNEQVLNLLKLDEPVARYRLGLILLGIARRLFGD